MLVIPLQEDEDLVEYMSGEESQGFEHQWMFSDVTLTSQALFMWLGIKYLLRHLRNFLLEYYYFG